MQDETLSQPLPLPRRRRTFGTVLLVALLAFALGGALVGWLAHSGRLPYALPSAAKPAAPRIAAAPAPAARPTSPPGNAAPLGSVEVRLALLEDRLSRIDGEANAASGNAARAEALLIAFAARRRVEQGKPLGYVAEQLKLRFGDAQPKAVETIIAAARMPVTLDELASQLEAAAPSLIGLPVAESTWARIRREITALFVVRRAPASAATPKDRLSHARLLLASGRIDEAIAEIEHLPGAGDAQAWIEQARRYEDTQRALDLIETTAMLEPRNLRDTSGKPVEQPTPLAPPATDAAIE
jgi:cell division septation protein DedD